MRGFQSKVVHYTDCFIRENHYQVIKLHKSMYIYLTENVHLKSSLYYFCQALHAVSSTEGLTATRAAAFELS